MQSNIIDSLHLQFPKSPHPKSQVFINVIITPTVYCIASSPLGHLLFLKKKRHVDFTAQSFNVTFKSNNDIKCQYLWVQTDITFILLNDILYLQSTENTSVSTTVVKLELPVL